MKVHSIYKNKKTLSWKRSGNSSWSYFPMFVSQWLLRRWRESEGHLCPRRLLCGNSTLPSVSPLMAPLPPSLHHGCSLFEHQPPKVNYRHPIPPSSLFTPHTHTLSKTPPSSQCAESTLVQEGCSCFRGPGSALLGRLCLEVGVREAAAFTRQRGLFKKKKKIEAGGRGKGAGWTVRAKCASYSEHNASPW